MLKVCRISKDCDVGFGALFFILKIELVKNIQGDFQRIEFVIHCDISGTSIFCAINEMLELQLEGIIFVNKNPFDQGFLLVPQ